MDFKGLIEALEKFFLDIIGTLVPGIAALIAAVTLCSVSFDTLWLPDEVRAYSPALWLALAYVSGHAVISVGQLGLIPLINSLRGLPLIGAIVRRLFGKALPYDRPPAEPHDPLMQAFFATLRRRDPEFAQQLEPANYGEMWRDAALSIAPEQTALVNRFTFISLLNLGMATVSFLIPLVWLGLIVIESAGQGPHVQAFSITALLLWIPAILFLER
jgi:hypothetical protein